ncbi:ATP-binding cassette domain-containing protein [Desmospora activa]|uniref:ABC transporter family protein n=1 Tax=Desmospora activa DSM 45169 TaxID=1121389 RepID=A0A2T4ZA15_9BACL|nr:ATP-binding cassette domain-containing protein [Desmospora activa]PTM58732.1 ABC transporter family protein [Desmospora activa DSM 45169]
MVVSIGLKIRTALNEVIAVNEVAVQAKGLVKSFGKKRTVDGVDLSIQAGTVYGFLGPNGAGKTTTIRMLSTLLRPDEGQASIFGHDLISETDAIRKCISLTGQYTSIDEDLTGFENLVPISRLMGFSRKQAKVRADELLVLRELVYTDITVNHFSLGQPSLDEVFLTLTSQKAIKEK